MTKSNLGDFIWAYDFRGLKVHCGQETWKQDQEAKSSHTFSISGTMQRG